MNGLATTATAGDMRRASLTRNVVAMYALQIANYLIPLVTLPYLIRVLGAGPYGAMALAYAVVFFMVLFVDAGFNTLATRRLATPGISAARVAEIYVSTQAVKLAQGVAAALLLWVLIAVVPAVTAAWPIYVATFPIVLGSLLFPTWLFQGLEIMHVTTLCSIGGRLLATAGIFVFVHSPDDIVMAALLQGSATALSGLLSLPLVLGRLRRHLRIPRRRLSRLLRETIGEARGLAPAEFLTHAIDNSGVFILGLFAGNATVGVYAAIDKIARAGASLFQPLTKALFPALTGCWVSGAADAAERCRAWTRRLLALATIAGIALYLLAPGGLGLLFGEDWARHASLLRVLALWLTASVAATVLGQFWLLARGQRVAYSSSLLKAGILQLLAAVAGASFFGSHGLVVAGVFAEFARLALFRAAVRRGERGVSSCAS